jgi:hypothetical protein
MDVVSRLFPVRLRLDGLDTVEIGFAARDGDDPA